MAKKFNLKIIEGNNVGTMFELLEGVRYEVRRSPAGAIPSDIDRKKTVFLDDTEISKLHAAVLVVAGELVVQDLGSTNGVIVNSKRINKSLLVNGDRVKMGTTVLQVHMESDKPSEGMTFVGRASSKYSKETYEFKKLTKALDEKITFQPPVKMDSPFDVNSKNGKLFLEAVGALSEQKRLYPAEEESLPEMINGFMFQVLVMNGPLEGEKFHFYNRNIVIGRTKDLWIPDTSVSREHAEVSVYGNGIFKIKDLSSQNGTFINDMRIQTATFKETDIVKLGDTVLSFSYTPEEF